MTGSKTETSDTVGFALTPEVGAWRRSGVAEIRTVAAAFSIGGDVAVWRAWLTEVQAGHLDRALSALADLGHVAAFTIAPEREVDWAKMIGDIRSRCGALAVDACLMASEHQRQAQPAFLMPVWPFDHELDGSPASTAQFLGLDLELIAARSPSEEVGACIPGRDGRWLVYARPMF